MLIERVKLKKAKMPSFSYFMFKINSKYAIILVHNLFTKFIKIKQSFLLKYY